MQSKNIVIFSFIGLFIAVMVNVLLYRYFLIEELILKQSINNNINIAEIYKHEILVHHKLSLKILDNYRDNNKDIKNNLMIFIKDSVNFFQDLEKGVSLFNSNGEKLIHKNKTQNDNTNNVDYSGLYKEITSYTDKYFLKQYLSKNPLDHALKGETKNVILSEQDELKNNHIIISTYIPIIDKIYANFEVLGVIKITTDVTKEWNKIAHLEKMAFIVFIVVFFIFFIIVMHDANDAQRIIKQQFDENRNLKAEKLKAEQENFAKTEFLANVSHELRTPLNSIIGFSEIILSDKNEKLQNQKYEDYIKDINNSGKHLLAVINDILDFSKVAANKLTIENIKVDLNKILSSSIRFVKPRANDNNISLICEMPNEHIVVTADPKRLKQSVLNLLSNAVKFTNTGGIVKGIIEYDPKKKLVYLIVEDNGIGMKEKDVPKALSSFGQVDNSLSKKYDGTGLGLPLTKRLVELMNGTFNLKSELNKGTRVTLTLPYTEIVELDG